MQASSSPSCKLARHPHASWPPCKLATLTHLEQPLPGQCDAVRAVRLNGPPVKHTLHEARVEGPPAQPAVKLQGHQGEVKASRTGSELTERGKMNGTHMAR